MGRIFICTLFIFLTFAFSTLAQSPWKVLKQAEKVHGGAKAMQSISSWQKTGTIKRNRDGASGQFASQASKPNLYHENYDIGGFELESGYNGRSGWVRDSRSGLSTLTGDASSDFQAEALYRNSLWLDHKKQKSKIASGGTVAIDGKTQNIVILGTSKGVNVRLFFDSATDLLTREEIPLGETVKTYDYSDYRKVGPTMQAFRVISKNGNDSFEISLDDIKINAPVPRTVFDFPQVSSQPLPDIRALLTQLQENEDEVEKILDTYSFVQKSTKRGLGKDGILREVESETLQLSFYKGYRISRVIEKNGKPLNEKDQRDADKDAERRVDEIERTIAKQAKSDNTNADRTGPDGPRVSVAELLRASNLINPRRERFRGRDVIVFDFEPNPSFDYKNAKSILKFFGKTAGVMWIDEKDKQVARLEAFLADSYNIGGGMLAKLRKGASFTLEQERVNDEIWLPSVADINLSVRVLLVKGIDVNQIVRSYDYRKFTTEVKDAKVDEVKNP
jgi:hypothetical protein